MRIITCIFGDKNRIVSSQVYAHVFHPGYILHREVITQCNVANPHIRSILKYPILDVLTNWCRITIPRPLSIRILRCPALCMTFYIKVFATTIAK
ncbi:MAG: hypothetical protein KAI99_13570 [Cyclobacteriaceae bacterium]|nr:hypothetical protein [Cyclobacteriaceae bacterium]